MALTIKGLCKAFGEKQVLSALNLTLENDGVYCLMGPSGMGKTTLLRIILGLEQADGGSVTGITSDEISAMFQEDRLIPSLSAIENVALVSPKKSKTSEIAKQLARILPKDCLHQPICQLSGGMKRRVALARAMHFPSKLIILDEPFTGLDEETRRAVISYVLDMRGDRILLVATHGVDDAALLGAKTIRLDELQADGTAPVRDAAPEVQLEDVLAQVQMFDGISPERFRPLISKLFGREVEYKARQVIWQPLAPCEELGIVLRGSIQAEDVSQEAPQIIQRFYAGSSFGEGIAFGNQSSWVLVRAAEDSRVLFLPAKSFRHQQTDPDVIRMMVNLLGEFSNKLQLMTLKNQILSEPRLRNKILMYLSTLPEEPDGFKRVPFLQKDLAQYLDVNRSSFNRELGRMKDEGILEAKGQRMRVHWEKQQENEERNR